MKRRADDDRRGETSTQAIAPALSTHYQPQCKWPYGPRQQCRRCPYHRTCVTVPVSADEAPCSGAIGAACEVPETAAKTSPATAIAKTVFNIIVLSFWREPCACS